MDESVISDGIEYNIYIPTSISEEEYIQILIKELAGFIPARNSSCPKGGGLTTYDVSGAWLGDKGEMCKEPVCIYSIIIPKGKFDRENLRNGIIDAINRFKKELLKKGTPEETILFTEREIISILV